MSDQTQPPPEEIRLAAVVLARLGGRVRNFCIRLDGNGLVLQGQTATYYVKQLAQQYVMEGTSLPIRANDIEVR